MEELSFQEKLSVRLKALDGAFFLKNIYIYINFFFQFRACGYNCDNFHKSLMRFGRRVWECSDCQHNGGELEHWVLFVWHVKA